MLNGAFERAKRVRVVIWLLVLAAVVVFAAVNTDDVSVDWVFDETEAPLWLVIAASAVAGAVIGAAARAAADVTDRGPWRGVESPLMARARS